VEIRPGRAGRRVPEELPRPFGGFEKMLTYSNHLGLFAEEIGSSGEALARWERPLKIPP